MFVCLVLSNAFRKTASTGSKTTPLSFQTTARAYARNFSLCHKTRPFLNSASPPALHPNAANKIMRQTAEASFSTSTQVNALEKVSLPENKEYSLGQKIHGFEVKVIQNVQELNLVAIILEDARTGAKWLHLKRDDNNNLFSVGFATSVDDSTGVPHILEHTVLCGSEKYPVRDPFFKMLNRSMSTFMNAWTAHNYTQYPFSTQNWKDYENLQKVYLDAVFNPLLKEQDFLQEGWRLERDESGQYQIKGVVYNEMKGAFSDAGSLLHTRTDHHLFPGTTYEHESGGDPANITDLTHENLLNFYKKHYHPSNAKFFSYGNFPLEPQLARVSRILEKYEKIEPPVAEHFVKPYGTKIVEESGPVEGSGEAQNQTKFSISFLMNDITDVHESFKAQIFSSLLLNGTSAPMHQALIDSGLGPDFSANTGYNNQPKQSALTIGLQGINKDKIAEIELAIQKTFQQVLEDGFETQRVQAVIHSIELTFKHRTAHFGMTLMQMVSSGWFLNIDPLQLLQVESLLKSLKEGVSDKHFFSDIINKYILNSNHTLKFTMLADPEYPAQQVELEKKITSLKAAQLDEAKMKLIDEQASELAKVQRQQEDISCLPTLVLDDISKKVDRFATNLSSVSKVPVQWRETNTNGISYLRMIQILPDFPNELVPYLQLFCDSLTYVGTKSRKMSEIETEINLYTGGITVSPFASTDYNNVNSSEVGVSFTSNCLDLNTEKMFGLLSELIFETDFSNTERLKTLITASASGIFNRIAESGHMFARNLAASSISPESSFNNMTSGISQSKFISQLSKSISTDPQTTFAKITSSLNQIRSLILSTETTRVAMTTEPDSYDNNVKYLAKFLSRYSEDNDGSSDNNALSFAPKPSRFLLPLPFASNFAARSVLTVPYTHPDSVTLQVLAKVLTPNFLHREIRESNGAYGGGAGFSSINGLFNFYSYRDPNPAFSIDSFTKSIEFACKNKFDERQLSESKLSLFKELDAPISVSQEGMFYFKHGITDSMRQERRDKLFSISSEDLQEVAQKYLLDPTAQPTSDAVIGNSTVLSAFESESELKPKPESKSENGPQPEAEQTTNSKPAWSKIELE